MEECTAEVEVLLGCLFLFLDRNSIFLGGLCFICLLLLLPNAIVLKQLAPTRLHSSRLFLPWTMIHCARWFSSRSMLPTFRSGCANGFVVGLQTPVVIQRLSDLQAPLSSAGLCNIVV